MTTLLNAAYAVARPLLPVLMVLIGLYLAGTLLLSDNRVTLVPVLVGTTTLWLRERKGK
jgi:hypothetical protein